MSWKPEVKVIGDDKWYDNALRFTTEKEAKASARDLNMRWSAVAETRATESTDEVNQGT